MDVIRKDQYGRRDRGQLHGGGVTVVQYLQRLRLRILLQGWLVQGSQNPTL